MFLGIRMGIVLFKRSLALTACPSDKREQLTLRRVCSIVEVILTTDVSLNFMYMTFAKSVYTIQ
jgi:hypothetical protein